jgi:hypothetical protein
MEFWEAVALEFANDARIRTPEYKFLEFGGEPVLLLSR